MISSMTGYGAAGATEQGVRYTVEIRSLNNRYYKAGIKLPEGMQWIEPDVDRWMRESLGRGSISYTLRIRDDGSAAAGVNVGALRGYVERLQSLRGEGTTIDLAALLALPGVCDATELTEDAMTARKGVVERLSRKAIAALEEMRRREGQALREHLLKECAAVREHLDAVRTRAPAVVLEYHEKLAARVARLLQQAQLDLDRDLLAREVAVYADRCDIMEEITRLGSHLDQFTALCDSREEAGRKLDFLAQEMLREANTIGSKSNDADITRRIVDIKASIDRIKEQVQNVE